MELGSNRNSDMAKLISEPLRSTGSPANTLETAKFWGPQVYQLTSQLFMCIVSLNPSTTL